MGDCGFWETFPPCSLGSRLTIKAKLFIFLLFPNDCNFKNVNRCWSLLLENRWFAEFTERSENSVFSFQGARCQIKWSRSCHGLAEGQPEIAHWARYQSEQAVRHDAIWKRKVGNHSDWSVAKHNAARWIEKNKLWHLKNVKMQKETVILEKKNWLTGAFWLKREPIYLREWSP